MAQVKLDPKEGVKGKWAGANAYMLLDLWEDNIEEFRGAGKNSHTYRRIAEALGRNGIVVSAMDVKNKIESMTRKYRIEKQKIGPSGGLASLWEYFSRVQKILGAYKPFNLEEVTADSIVRRNLTGFESKCDVVSISPLDSDTESPMEALLRKRKTSDDEEQYFWDQMLANSEERTAATKELVAATKRMKETLSSHVENFMAKSKNPVDAIQTSQLYNEFLNIDCDTRQSPITNRFPFFSPEAVSEFSSDSDRSLSVSRKDSLTLLMKMQQEKLQLEREKFQWQKEKDLQEFKLKEKKELEELKLNEMKMLKELNLKEKKELQELENQFKIKQLELEQNECLKKFEIEMKYKNK